MPNIEDIAAQRARIHASHTSSRPLSPDYELVGVAGEAALRENSQLSWDDLVALWEKERNGLGPLILRALGVLCAHIVQ
jgi:hypothetical protein